MAWCCWVASFKLYLACLLPIVVVLALYRLKRFWHRRNGKKTVAFFHPYCNAGGGGERVLWEMVKIVQQDFPNKQIIVYTGDVTVSPEQILARVANNLKIEIQPTIQFVFLQTRTFVEASRYPIFTLLGQSLGSVVLGLEAITRFAPDYFIDSMGYSWTYPVVKIMCGSRVCCYTHYPTISTDMLNVVSQETSSFNNRPFIARSPFLTQVKIAYYKIFAFLYGWTSRFSDLVFVNSSWTKGHIDKLWGENNHLLYPPCDTRSFDVLTTTNKVKGQVISIAQFRPEKNHELQLKSFRRFLDASDGNISSESKLVVVGSSRNAEDEERVQQLLKTSRKLGLEGKVEIQVNISFRDLLKWMENSTIGIHSMINEHFGIGIVEMMAAGVIVIGHASGGPKLDIITEGETGFLATNEEEYAEKMLKIASMDENELDMMRRKARLRAKMFSQASFREKLVPLLSNFFCD